MLDDLERLMETQCWRMDQIRFAPCILPTDPLVDYLVSIETYRTYIYELRGEQPVGDPE